MSWERAVGFAWRVPEQDDPNVSHLEPDQLTAVSRELASSASSDWMTIEERIEGELPVRGNGTGDPSVIGRGVQIRSVYDVSFVRDPAAMERLLSCTRTGHEVRFTEQAAPTMRIADGDAVLIQSSPPQLATVLIRDVQSAVMWRMIFEMVWAQALPLAGSPS